MMWAGARGEKCEASYSTTLSTTLIYIYAGAAFSCVYSLQPGAILIKYMTILSSGRAPAYLVAKGPPKRESCGVRGSSGQDGGCSRCRGRGAK